MHARENVKRAVWSSSLLLAAVVACQGDPSSTGKGAPPEPAVAPAAAGPSLARRPNLDRSVGAKAAPLPGNPLGTLPGKVASVDRARGLPTFVWTPRLAPARGGNNAVDAALSHLERYASAYQLGPSALDTVVARRVHDTGRGGIVVELGQRIDDVDVFRDEVNVMMTQDLELVAFAGHLHPKASPGLLRLNAMRFELSAADALALAVTDLYDTAVDGADLVRAGARHGYDLFQPADGALVLDGERRQFTQAARVKPVLFPMPRGLVPAYFVELDIGATTSRSSDAYQYVVSARDGVLLYRYSLTVADSFTYTVWADTTAPFTPGDSPMEDTTPHPTPMPSGIEPGFIEPVQVTIEGFNENPMGAADPWLPEGATETTGNNVDAYADHAMPDGFGAGDTRADVTSPGAFDRVYDPTLAPLANDTQIKAAVTQLFYVNNWLHDWFYDSGFDEAGSNAQADNYGRGGLDGDPLLAEAQDTGGMQTNNANMSAFADGASPRMQMYIFDFMNPDRDGTIDNGIVAHEWGHYIHIRLANCGFTTQCGAMGEGWGDFLALMMVVRPGDNTQGSFATAPYASAGIGSDPTFFGIRRMAYSANFDVNSATFRHIGNDQELPEDMPLSANSQPNAEVHNAGEIWATIMTEVYIAMLEDERFDFDEAKRRMTDYVVAGLKMTPPSATWTEARDAILAAAAASDTDDLVVIASAFARRGLGTGAIAPDRNSTDLNGVVEDYDIRGSLSVNRSNLVGSDDCDGDGVLDAGDSGELTIEVLNVGAADLENTTATVSSTNPGVLFPAGTDLTFAPMGPFDIATATVPVSISPTLFGLSRLEVTVEISDPDSAITPVTAVVNPRINNDRGPSTIDDVEAPDTAWTVESTVEAWNRADFASGNTVWQGVEPEGIGDEMLVSPPLEVSASEDFVIHFSHRYQFASLDLFGLFELLFGGGVIEYSTDDGGSWTDVATIADPGYGEPLTPFISDNPIAGNPAFTKQNPSLPEMDDVTVNLGTALAGETVLIRFRLTSAGGVAAPGWDVDEIAFEGIDNTPFDGPIEDGGCAEEGAPVADAGPDQTVMAGVEVTLDGSASFDPDGDPLTFMWQQVEGPDVALSDAAAEMPTFTAPTASDDTVLRFALHVEAGGTLSAPDSVIVTVEGTDVPDEPDAGVPDAPDAGDPEPGVDAGPTNPGNGDGTDDAGCGCRTGNAGGSGGAGLLVLLVGAALLRRRRQR